MMNNLQVAFIKIREISGLSFQEILGEISSLKDQQAVYEKLCELCKLPPPMVEEEEEEEEEENKNKNEKQFTCTLYECPKCGKKESCCKVVQTRATDEGMTCKLECICGKTWTVSG
jgi:DNA-directed RNA polymerase subunit M/transcription elongation factor TFIIS